MTPSRRLVGSALFLVVSTTLLSGCTTAYQAPQTADSATMIVHDASSRTMGVRMFRDAAECTGGQPLMPVLASGEQRTIYLSTHGEVAMSINQGLGVQGGYQIEFVGCQNTFSFFPKPGRTYLLEVGTTEWCSVALFEKDPSNQRNSIPTEIIRRKRTSSMPFTEEGPFCIKR